MDILSGLTLAAPAGLNAYIPLLAVALAQRFGWLELGTPWELLGEWWSIALIAVLLVVEIVADKVPAVDHVNDVVQTSCGRRPAACSPCRPRATSARARWCCWCAAC